MWPRCDSPFAYGQADRDEDVGASQRGRSRRRSDAAAVAPLLRQRTDLARAHRAAGGRPPPRGLRPARVRADRAPAAGGVERRQPLHPRDRSTDRLGPARPPRRRGGRARRLLRRRHQRAGDGPSGAQPGDGTGADQPRDHRRHRTAQLGPPRAAHPPGPGDRAAAHPPLRRRGRPRPGDLVLVGSVAGLRDRRRALPAHAAGQRLGAGLLGGDDR
jgi:hypothetical protein